MVEQGLGNLSFFLLQLLAHLELNIQGDSKVSIQRHKLFIV